MTTPLQVQTTTGILQGATSASHPSVAQWLGVPFAEPPTGPRRFAPPVPKSAWTGGRDATAMPPAPVQSYTSRPDAYAAHLPGFLARGPYSEDCLYLNVFVAGGRENKKLLPVLVCSPDTTSCSSLFLERSMVLVVLKFIMIQSCFYL